VSAGLLGKCLIDDPAITEAVVRRGSSQERSKQFWVDAKFASEFGSRLSHRARSIA
jgi:hypothetical protein